MKRIDMDDSILCMLSEIPAFHTTPHPSVSEIYVLFLMPIIMFTHKRGRH